MTAEFRTPGAFRAWLERHHDSTPELVIRLFKVHAAERGITYSQALDEALCFGWIDGIRRGHDEDSFTIRFTPRRPRSTWSLVNVAHVKRLAKDGRMAPPGLAAYNARDQKRTGLYSFENRPTRFSPALGKTFRADSEAWAYFKKQAPWYRRTSIYWVMSAKQRETQEKRLAILISCSHLGKPIPQLDRGKK